LVSVLGHPLLQGSMRRSESRRCATGLHKSDVLWLRRPCRQRLIRPLALLPGLWHEPATGPQRGQEHRKGRAGPSGSRGVGCGGEPRIRGAASPCGVSILPDACCLYNGSDVNGGSPEGAREWGGVVPDAKRQRSEPTHEWSEICTTATVIGETRRQPVTPRTGDDLPSWRCESSACPKSAQSGA
jgi:hypothetical protein